jgi:hypothetical protein
VCNRIKLNALLKRQNVVRQREGSDPQHSLLRQELKKNIFAAFIINRKVSGPPYMSQQSGRARNVSLNISSGMLRRVSWYKLSDVSETLIASIIRLMMEETSTTETSISF